MIQTVCEGLDHPEGVAWGPDGFLYAGGEAGQIYRIDVTTGNAEEIASTGGLVLGIALDADANVYACDPKRRQLLRVTQDGNITVLLSDSPESPLLNPNYPVFDALGTLYVSDSGEWPSGGGRIYRLPPSGAAELWSTAAPHFTNGLAISPDGDYLYVAESTLPGITRIPILEDGSAGDAEIVTLLPGTVPDGLAFDVEGRLFIGCYRPDRIYSIEPDGQLLIVADDYQGTILAAPTNLAFGGPERTTMYIASLARWHVGSIDVLVPGAPIFYPAIPIPTLEEN